MTEYSYDRDRISSVVVNSTLLGQMFGYKHVTIQVDDVQHILYYVPTEFANLLKNVQV